MSFVDALLNPRAAIGCVVGIVARAGLQWLLPGEGLLFGQACIIVIFTVVGHILEYRSAGPP